MELHETRMGRKLIEADLPRAIRALEQIAEALEKLNKPRTYSITLKTLTMGWMKEVWRLMQDEGMSQAEAYDHVAEQRRRRELEGREMQNSRYERGSAHNQK